MGTNNNLSDVYFLCPSLNKAAGVGSARSRSLLDYFKSKGLSIKPIQQDKSSMFSIIFKLFFIKNKSYLIYSIGPFKLVPIIIFLKYLKKVNLIIDIRDPWYLNKINAIDHQNHKPKWRFLWIKFLENKLLALSWKTFVCTPGLLNYYKKQSIDNSKITLLTNGFSGQSKNLRPKYLSGSKTPLNIICTGKFAVYSHQKATNCLIRLESEINKNKIKNFKLSFFGSDREKIDYILKSNKLHNLKSHTNYYPFVPFEQLNHYFSQSHLALMIIRNEEYDLGTKAYDYVSHGLPIFDSLEENSNARFFFKEYIIKDLSKLQYHHVSSKSIVKFKRTEIYKNNSTLNKMIERISSHYN